MRELQLIRRELQRRPALIRYLELLVRLNHIATKPIGIAILVTVAPLYWGGNGREAFPTLYGVGCGAWVLPLL